jgi:hypothetical protein
MSAASDTISTADALISEKEPSAGAPDGLDTEERELLELLGTFMDRLETYLENH